MDFTSCLEKQQKIKELFTSCQTSEERYFKLIELGKALPPLDPRYKTEENLVSGCQSQVFLHTYIKDGLIYFEAASEALISAGLVALLIQIYSGQPPEALFKCPPTFLNELGIYASLSPARSNGLAQIYLRMQKEALSFLSSMT